MTDFILSLLAVTFHCNVGSKHQDGPKLVIFKLRYASVDYPKFDFVCFIESGVCEQKQTQRLRERTYGCQGNVILREFGMDRYTLLYLKWITDKDLLCSTWNSTQCYVAA